MEANTKHEHVDLETGEIMPPDADELELAGDQLAPDELDEEGRESEHEQDDAQLAAAGVTPEMLEQRAKSWERERDRHMRELKKRDEQRYDASEVCPLCDGHGLFFPALPEPEATSRRQYMTMVLGGDAPPTYKQHPTEVMCEQCDGLGKLYTGSKVPAQDVLNCPRCNGTGHIAHGTQQTLAAVPALTTPPGGTLTPVPPEEQARVGLDAWQRPPGHPHYGMPPSAVGV